MEHQQIKNVVEAALASAARPLEVNELLRIFDEAERPDRKALVGVIDELSAEYEGRAFEIKKVASGYRLQVKADYGEWLGRIGGQRAPRYSRALLETLALVAYRQPVTRGEIEAVRGVSVSSNIVRTLLERGWVRIVGHRDVPGRPAMLGTTKEFLDYFNLTSLDELPSLSELKDFDSINVELDFDGAPMLAPVGDDDDSVDDVDAALAAAEDAPYDAVPGAEAETSATGEERLDSAADETPAEERATNDDEEFAAEAKPVTG